MGTGTSKETNEAKEEIRKQAQFLHSGDRGTQINIEKLERDYPFRMVITGVYSNGEPFYHIFVWNGEYLSQTTKDGFNDTISWKPQQHVTIRCWPQGFILEIGDISMSPSPNSKAGAKDWQGGTILTVADDVLDSQGKEICSLCMWCIPSACIDGHTCIMPMQAPHLTCSILCFLAEDMTVRDVYSFPDIPEEYVAEQVDLFVVELANTGIRNKLGMVL